MPNNKAIYTINFNGLIYTFSSAIKITEFFKELIEQNRLNIENEQIKNILLNHWLINRYLRAKEGDEKRPKLRKESTKNKYLNIPNFEISRQQVLIE